MMNNLFQNGPKQVNIDGGLSNTNAFKNMVDNISMNQAQINEKLEQMGQRPTSFIDMRLENSFNNMNLNQNQNLINMQMQQNQNFINFDTKWNDANLSNSNQKNIIDINHNLYQQEQNLIAGQNFRFGMGAPQVHPMLFELNKTLQNENVNRTEITNPEKDSQEKENQNNVFKDIIDVMEAQDDERHQSSEFLKFIKKLQNGEIKLNEKTNDIDVTPKIKENKIDIYNQLYASNEEITDEKKLEEMWNRLESNLNDIEYNADYGDYQKERLFLKDNKFLNPENISDIDLVQLAKDFLSKGDSQSARMALEAEIQNNPDHSEAWLILGKIHTENDRDDLAMQCFLKAIDADPFNGDALLSLGISCTNEFDEFDAMVYIANWMKLHPVYNKFFEKNNPVLNYDMIRFEIENELQDEDYYSKAVRIQNLKSNFYNEMTQIMENISQNGTKDLDLLIAMGIANFIQHKNDKAIINFRIAVENFPNDYTAWNKLGAILAHSNMNEDAINTYKKALSLKPNYPRCWSNIGLAYFNLKNYDEAIRCFLTALKGHKNIDHVWSYLNSVMIAYDKPKLSELVYSRNLDELLKLFYV